MNLFDRLMHAWDAFRRPGSVHANYGLGNYSRPDVVYLRPGNEKSIVTSIYNRIALDAALVSIRHVRVDQNGSYLDDIHDALNERLTVEANIDQSWRQLILDLVISMFDEGVIAVVITEATEDPALTNIYDIRSLRIGKITQWYPQHVEVEVYNEWTGLMQRVVVPKKCTAIIENPFYLVMNAPNSTVQRLNKKLALLDIIDNRTGADKLDVLIQVPYKITSELQKEHAESRLRSIEAQLTTSKFGVAYIDGTEKVIQLNRPVENNLLEQVEYLTKMVFTQLSISEEILNGTADEKTMLNYQNRTVEPVLNAITDEFRRKFLTKTARTQGQEIMYIRNPFKLVPALEIANIADRLTRNEILSSNEVRGMIGFAPSDDPRADQLINKNLRQPDDSPKTVDQNQNGSAGGNT